MCEKRIFFYGQGVTGINKEKLIREIRKTCQYFKIAGMYGNNPFIERRISENLEDIAFIETLLDVFERKAKQKRFRDTIDRKRLKTLLMELEKVREDLDVKGW